MFGKELNNGNVRIISGSENCSDRNQVEKGRGMLREGWLEPGVFPGPGCGAGGGRQGKQLE